jgi:uncharacterized lipoprotein YmbA
MRRGVLGAALLVAGIPASCSSSPPSDYYVLSAESDPAAVRQVGRPWRTLAVGAVRLPGALDRPQIARRLGPNQLEYAEAERWAGPLDDMTRRVLSADLRPLLPAGTTMVADASSASADMTIAIEMARFDADKGGRVVLYASWETLGTNGKVVGLPREEKIIEPGTGSDAAAVTATMSRALAGLADKIAAGIGGSGAVTIR